MYCKKFTLTDRNIIQRVRFSIDIFVRCEAGKAPEFMDEMRLVVIAMFLRKIAPMNNSVVFNFQDRLLKAHDF